MTPEVRSVPSVAWPKSAASAAPLAESVPPDPSDRATLGQKSNRTPASLAQPVQGRAETGPQAQPETGPQAQPETGPQAQPETGPQAQAETSPQAQASSAASAPEDLWPLKLRLAERALALPEIAANQNLDKWAQSADPVTARYAGIRRAEAFSGPQNRLEELIARYGPVDGPTARLEHALHGKFSLEVVEPALLALSQGLAQKEPGPKTLPVLAAIASKALRTEGGEDFGQRAMSLLRNHAHVEGDLESALRRGPVPVVNRQVVLGPEPTASPQHKEQALEILSSMKMLREPIGADRLEEMNSPELAKAVVETVTLGHPTDEQILGMGLLLREATKRPALAALFQPHEAPLLKAAPRLQAMAHRGRGVAYLVTELIGFLKSPMDEATTRAQVDASLACSDHDSLKWIVTPRLTDLVARQPEMASVVGSSLLDSFQSRVPDTTDCSVLSSALTRGWKPDPLQRDTILSFLLPPLPDESGLQLTRYSYCGPMLSLAPKLGDLDGVVLPGPKGELLPYREALLEHLLVSEGDEKAFILDGRAEPTLGGGFEGKQALFELIAPEPDPALERRLLSALPEQLPTNLFQATHEVRNHLAILASIPLTPETRARLDAQLQACLPVEQMHFESLVKDERERQIEATRPHLTSPDLTTRLAGAERMVELCVLRGILQDQPPPAEMEPVRAAQASLAVLSESDRKQVAGWLSNRMVEAESLDELTPRQLADFMLAAPLVSVDETLERRMRAIAALDSKTMPAYNAREHLGTHLASLDHDQLRKGVPDSQVVSLMERLEKLRNWQMPEDFQAWAEGARGWSGELIERYGTDHLEEAYGAFQDLVGTGKPEEEWETLRTILTRIEMTSLMGPETRPPDLLGKALEIWRESRDRCDLDAVLQERGLVTPKSGGGVVETGNMVNVGGIPMRRRASR